MDRDNPIYILYDADCAFCNWCRAFTEKRDVKNLFVFLDIASNSTDFLFETRSISLDRVRPESIAAMLPGAVLYKGKATAFVLKNLWFPWSILGMAYGLLPVFLGDWIYDLASNNRALLCKITRCVKDQKRN